MGAWIAAHWSDIMLIVSVIGLILERKRAQTNGALARTLTGAIEVAEADDVKSKVRVAMETAPASVQLALEAALAQSTTPDPERGTPHKRSVGKEIALAAAPMLIERLFARRR